MKKILLFCVAALALTGCVNNIEPVVEIAGSHVLYATAETKGETKAQVADDGTFSWTVDSDKIKVSADGTSWSKYTATSLDGTKAIFTLDDGETSISAPAFGVFPSTLNPSYNSSTKKVTVTLPNTYAIKQGSSKEALMPMLSYVGGGSSTLSFKHLGGMLKVNLGTVAPEVTQFVATFSGFKVNGSFETGDVTSGTAEIGTEASSISGDDQITFNYTRTSGNEACILYIPLPVGTYSNGVQIDMKNNDGAVIARYTHSSFAITRADLIPTSSTMYDLKEVVNVASDQTSITLPSTTQGVTLDFSAAENVTDKNITISYASDKPKKIYIISPTNTEKGNITLSGDLSSSTVRVISGSFKAFSGFTAASTLIIEKGASFETIEIKGGNAQIDGNVQNVIIAAGATSGSDPVTVDVTNAANPPAITANAAAHIIAEKDVTLNVTVAAGVDPSKITTTGSTGTVHILSLKWDGTSTAELTQIDENTYAIYSAPQLAGFAAAVNASTPTSFAGKTVILMNDIDLDDKSWTPIGDDYDNWNVAGKGFQGTFDGNGKTISNLKVVCLNGGNSFAGLFGVVNPATGTTTTIKNLTIDKFTIQSNHQAGAIIGHAGVDGGIGGVVITGCTIKNGSLTSTPSTTSSGNDDANQVGAIAGALYNGTFTVSSNTVNTVSISGFRDLGGAVGFMTSGTFANNTLKAMTITQTDGGYTQPTWKVVNTVNEFIGRRSNSESTCNTAWAIGDGNTFNGTITMLSNYSTTWNGTSTMALTDLGSNTYGIYSAAQLAQFAADVNGGTTYAGKTVKLMTDIDLNKKAWTPIGLGGSSADDDLNNEINMFLGTFDGNHKTVSNLTVSQENGDRSFAGLFGNITVNSDKSVVIKDLTVSAVNITSQHMAAGILGRYYGKNTSASLTISNCSVVGTTDAHTITSSPFTNSSNKKESGNQVGGIVGNAYGNGVNISCCSVSGVTIQGTRDLGGIAGAMANGANTFSSNSVSNSTIQQVYPTDIEEGKDMSTVHEFVGRMKSGWSVPDGNTASSVTVIPQTQQ